MKTLSYKFVDYIPENIKEGVLYISLEYCTAIHKCACGCGQEVVTPLSPTDWSMTFDGRSVTLDPSIGNWSIACRSHYLVVKNNIRWASEWTEDEVKEGRKNDAKRKKKFFKRRSRNNNGKNDSL